MTSSDSSCDYDHDHDHDHDSDYGKQFHHNDNGSVR